MESTRNRNPTGSEAREKGGDEVKSDSDVTPEALYHQITARERELALLREQYLRKTGRLPARPWSDLGWRWAVFMAVGFAYISCFVYLLAISLGTRRMTPGVPEFFYHVDFAYFAILTFYFLIAMLAAKAHELAGHQVWSLLFGFWCAHWLVYDWAWWAFVIGSGFQPADAAFWQSLFYAPLFVPNPPMWLFLTLALCGSVMAAYAFFVPKNFREVAPPVIWLYTVYLNATICAGAGLDPLEILCVSLPLAIAAFVIAGIVTMRRVRQSLPVLKQKWTVLKADLKAHRWASDPLGVPWIFFIVAGLACTHALLIWAAPAGFLLGVSLWFFLPALWVFYRASTAPGRSRALRAALAAGLACVLFLVVVGMQLYAQ